MLLNLNYWNYEAELAGEWDIEQEKSYEQILFPCVNNTSTYISQNINYYYINSETKMCDNEGEERLWWVLSLSPCDFSQGRILLPCACCTFSFISKIGTEIHVNLI